MKYLRLTALIAFIGAALAIASIPVRSAIVSGSLTPAEAQADFDLMRKALEEAHGGLYRYSTKVEMDRMFDAERAKLNRPMAKTDFVAVMLETLAQIRCGHTGMTPDEETTKEANEVPMLPLRLMAEGRRLVVLFNDTPDDQTIRPGMEVLEINGKKSAELLTRILPKMPADGDIQTGKLARLRNAFARNYWLFVDKTSEFAIKARDAAGKIVTAKLHGVSETERMKNENPLNAEVKASLDKNKWWSENLALRFLKEPDIAEIRIGGFGGGAYPKWMEDTFRSLHEKGTKVLILDLRGNGGGADMYEAMLVSYLTDKPFRYFDHINVKTISPSFKQYSDWRRDNEPRLRELMKPNPAGGFLVPIEIHPGVAEQQPGKYPFMGKVFVLIDGGTFSTAADFCAVAHHLKRATFIGEETGGGYYGNNSGAMPILTLPNSKAQVCVPMFEYWNAVPGYDGKRRGTRPDLQVETTAMNLLRGVDEQLDAALKLVAQDAR